MMSPQSGRFLVYLLCALSTGCHIAMRHDRPRRDAPTAPASIDMGGAVSLPQSIPVPPQGLTLFQALSRAGGLRAGEDPADPAWLVAIQRQGSEGILTVHVPLHLVHQGLVGRFALFDGDYVQVLSTGSTSLGVDVQPAGPFVLGGQVPAPNVYHSKAGDRLVNVDSGDYGGPPAPEATVLLVSRIAQSGFGVEQFVIPRGSDELLDARIIPGDLLEFTRFEQVPVLVTGLTSSLMQDARREADRRRRHPREPRPELAGLTGPIKQFAGLLARPLGTLFR